MEAFFPKAILLDFYGTVVETDDAPISQICHQVAEASPLTPPPSEVSAYWSDCFDRICAQSFGATFQLHKDVERSALHQVLTYFEAKLDLETLIQPLFAYWSQPPLLPESKEVLANCRVPICLVSNMDNAELTLALQYHNLCFDWVVSSEDCRAYKPRGEIFQKALSALGLPAEEVCHVGDTIGSDVCGAKSQGIPVLWINRRNREIPDGDKLPDYISSDLSGVISILNDTVKYVPVQNNTRSLESRL